MYPFISRERISNSCLRNNALIKKFLKITSKIFFFQVKSDLLSFLNLDSSVVVMVKLDLSAAFDTIDHVLLLSHLICMEFGINCSPGAKFCCSSAVHSRADFVCLLNLCLTLFNVLYYYIIHMLMTHSSISQLKSKIVFLVNCQILSDVCVRIKL